MPRHQLIQLPSMILLGMVTAVIFSQFSITDVYYGIAALIVVIASLIFWMLPHSIDYAVVNPWFNRIMHFNMFICGILIIASLRKMMLEVKIFFLGMCTAMMIASGISLRVFDILLCSSFDIAQQKETGTYLIGFGAFLFVLTGFIFFRTISENRNQQV